MKNERLSFCFLFFSFIRLSCFFLIDMLNMHHMDLEPTTLPSIPLLREDKVSFELELIDLLSFMTSIVQ
jgi:hypothetical protein